MIKKIESYPELADPQLQPRYSGIPTFFRLPHTELLDEVDIGLVGVPFDGGVTNRPGARHGPRDIRNQSSLIRKINQATGVAPFELVRVADLGDAWIERPFELQGALAEIAAFFATVHAVGVTPLSVGGDHSISLPILRAIARDGPLGMVHVDAHCDTGSRWLWQWPRQSEGSLKTDSGTARERRAAVPIDWVQGVAYLDPDRPPNDVPRHRWRQFVDDCKDFLSSSEDWADRAAILGQRFLDSNHIRRPRRACRTMCG
jgi:hypothetical protein